MGGKDKGKKAAPKKELSEAEMKRMGFTDEQIKDMLAKRAMGADEKAKLHAEEEERKKERERAEKEAKKAREEEEKKAEEAKAEAKMAEYAALEAAKARETEEAAAAIEKMKADRRVYAEKVAQQRVSAVKDAQARRDAAMKEWGTKTDEEKAALLAEYDATAAAELEEVRKHEEAEASRMAADEEKKQREADLAAKREKVAAARQELERQGVSLGDEVDGDSLLDDAWKRGEALAEQGDQTKAARMQEKRAEERAGRAAMKDHFKR